jgi:hypothetical protein
MPAAERRARADIHRGQEVDERGGIGGVAQDELDVRTRGGERNRAGAEERTAQERTPITRRCVLPPPGPELATVDDDRQVVPAPPGTARRRGTRSVDRDADRRGEMDRRAGRGVVERPESIGATAEEQPEQLGPAAAGTGRLDARELALDLGREQDGTAQETWDAGRRMRR